MNRVVDRHRRCAAVDQCLNRAEIERVSATVSRERILARKCKLLVSLPLERRAVGIRIEQAIDLGERDGRGELPAELIGDADHHPWRRAERAELHHESARQIARQLEERIGHLHGRIDLASPGLRDPERRAKVAEEMAFDRRTAGGREIERRAGLVVAAARDGGDLHGTAGRDRLRAAAERQYGIRRQTVEIVPGRVLVFHDRGIGGRYHALPPLRVVACPEACAAGVKLIHSRWIVADCHLDAVLVLDATVGLRVGQIVKRDRAAPACIGCEHKRPHGPRLEALQRYRGPDGRFEDGRAKRRDRERLAARRLAVHGTRDRHVARAAIDLDVIDQPHGGIEPDAAEAADGTRDHERPGRDRSLHGAGGDRAGLERDRSDFRHLDVGGERACREDEASRAGVAAHDDIGHGGRVELLRGGERPVRGHLDSTKIRPHVGGGTAGHGDQEFVEHLHGNDRRRGRGNDGV